MAEGKTKYTPVDGTPGLKQAIIAKFWRDNALDYAPEQILVSCGGKQSFTTWPRQCWTRATRSSSLRPIGCRIRHGDFAGGVPVLVHAGADQQFKITPAQLCGALTDKTRLSSSTARPTRPAWRNNAEELAALGEVLRDFPKVAIATDDMYEHIRWNTDEPFVNIVNAART